MDILSQNGYGNQIWLITLKNNSRMQVENLESLYLISNACGESFPDNRLSHFKNQIRCDKKVDLDNIEATFFSISLDLNLSHNSVNKDGYDFDFAVIEPKNYSKYVNEAIKYQSFTNLYEVNNSQNEQFKFEYIHGGNIKDSTELFDQFVRKSQRFKVNQNNLSPRAIIVSLNDFCKKTRISKCLKFSVVQGCIRIKYHTVNRNLILVFERRFFKKLGLFSIFHLVDGKIKPYRSKSELNRNLYFVECHLRPNTVYEGAKIKNLDLAKHPAIINVHCKQIVPYQHGDKYSQIVISFPIYEDHFKKYITLEPKIPAKFRLNTNFLSLFEIEILDEHGYKLPLSIGSPTILKILLNPKNMAENIHHITVSSKHYLFPNNNNSDFTFKLSSPLNLQENAKIFVKQIIYPSRIMNLSTEFTNFKFYVHILYDIETDDPDKFYFTIKQQYFESTQHFISLFTQHPQLKSILEINEKYGICTMKPNYRCKVYIPLEFKDVFGFGPEEYLTIINENDLGDLNQFQYTTSIKDKIDRSKRETGNSISNKYISLDFSDMQKYNGLDPIDITRLIPKNVFLYCDSIRSSLVGDRSLQVIKTFSPEPNNESKYTPHEFNFKEFKILNTRVLDTMQFKVRSDFGSKIEFLNPNDNIFVSLEIHEKLK